MRKRTDDPERLAQIRALLVEGKTSREIGAVLGGTNMPKGEYLLRLISFFDAGFVNTLIGGHGAHVIKLSDKRAIDAARMIAEGAAILKSMEGG